LSLYLKAALYQI